MDNSNQSYEIAKLFHEIMVLFRHNIGNIFEEKGMTVTQMMVMGILSKENTIKITDLSGKLSLSNSTVSGIVDRLENMGLVVRNRSEQDRRVVYVSVSPKFSEMHEHYHQLILKKIACTLSKASSDDQAKIIEGLELLKTMLNN
ncbi:transcriptional regulator [Desulfosporosinus acidiphilus SJ4]|uniref:Transcriptional regulator n=1 Tax=Desulfosporosinus acidiphilus (strain DSM 22704 / JCM 16185 / SJ4) TaxID=646529 RepID=I4D1W2_DESAJ|nr:MarR family transcriptional regulator [Desulfosporosinus acidiphilus]AFM39786.1 transcriptional regulator [Desulfosporosinus acidiphilus SJ4]